MCPSNIGDDIQGMQDDGSIDRSVVTGKAVDVPVVGKTLESVVDPLSQLDEPQWHELTARAKEVVKKRAQDANKGGSVIEPDSKEVAEDTLKEVDPLDESEGRCRDVPDATPQISVRQRTVSKFKKSPFVNEFGSTEKSASTGPCSQLSKRSTFRLIHPFLRPIRVEPDMKLVGRWAPWIDHKVIRKSKLGNLYPASINNLVPTFNFGVYVVDKKEWFHLLNYGSKDLRTTHLDVLFYYLRKKAKYDQGISVRVTTTDCQFDAMLRDVYADFIMSGKDMAVVDSAKAINDIISGCSLWCNTPWVQVDDILFPVMVSHQWHWILARLSLKERVIYVYDSKPGDPSYNEEVIRAMEPYSNMLPIFLSTTDILKKRPELFYSGSPYYDKALGEPFLMVFSPRPPAMMKRDYAVFAAVFAEYYIQYQSMPSEDDDLSGVRGRYAMYLWYYGMKKQMQCVVSDEDD